MRLLVCGGRDYADAAKVKWALDSVNAKRPVTMLIEGGALGADRLAQQWAGEMGIHYATVNAHWEKYGKAAGHRRNAAMLTLQPEGVVAFPGGRGTTMMIKLAKEAGITVWEIQP